MKKWSIFFFLISVLNFVWACENNSTGSNDDDNKSSSEKWLLVWQDEFDSSQVDAGKWNFEQGAGGWGNNEWQYYTNRSANIHINSGNMVIQAMKENYQGSEYTSARLTTRNKGDFLYGRVEARIKLPRGKGIWPAFWMMPTNSDYGGWAASGEIDIMEFLGHDLSTVYGTIHYGGSWPDNVHTGTSYKLPQLLSFSDNFHVFAIEWDSKSINWFVDDSLYQTQTSWHTNGQQFPAPFDKPFYVILNVAVGGNWPGYPDASTQFPQKMMIDYVRVYQLNPEYKND